LTEITILDFGKNETGGVHSICKAEAEKNPKLLYPALAFSFGVSDPLDSIKKTTEK
jgi:hypothetical protein